MRAAFQSAIRDRAYLAPFVIGGILLVILLVMGVVHIRVSELQVPVRYSSFGITNFYREQWFYQLAFMFFGILVYGFHTLISLKLAEKKSQAFAIAFQWMTAVILLITVVTVAAIFRVASLI